eukprot:TRINITY_DN15942_c0_g1_i13.p7 TRINITY_DN15942_c0_g1~~TRINITY_DN15942_c0_g1_i13.p7  ORF type:complete len:113 (-),score=3.75 TRINITY_DN15942_c0_g1_i13:471-809(-)
MITQFSYATIFCIINCKKCLLLCLINNICRNRNIEQWPDFGCEGIKVQRAHQPTSQCQGKKKIIDKRLNLLCYLFNFLNYVIVSFKNSNNIFVILSCNTQQTTFVGIFLLIR